MNVDRESTHFNSEHCEKFIFEKSHFFIKSSEKLFKKAADVIAAEGYKEAGYEYIIIDDCWLEKERDPVTNRLVPDRKRFPSGLNALADYVRDIFHLNLDYCSL